MKRSPRTLIAAGAIVVGAAVAPAASAFPVTAVFQFGLNAMDAYANCATVGGPCVAPDSLKITEILKNVTELRKDIAANQESVNNQLGLLQKTLDQNTLLQYQTKLEPIYQNMPRALVLLNRLMECAQAAERKAATCANNAGNQAPVNDARKSLEDALKYIVGLWSDDIRATAALYSGSAFGGEKSGLIGADWLMHKNDQDNNAGVTNVPVKDSMKVSVLTPGLANSTAKFASSFDDVIESYAFLKPFVAGLNGQRVKGAEMQEAAQGAIYDRTNPYSVASRTTQFTLPRLLKHEIIFINASDGRAYAISTNRENHSLGGVVEPWLMFDFGRAINAYGQASKFMQNRPAAFGKDGWYRVRAKTHRVEVCPTTTIADCQGVREGGNFSYTRVGVNQLSRGDDTTVITRMRLTNAKPTWDSAFETSANGTNGVNFKSDFEHFLTGPATFDWHVLGYGPRCWMPPDRRQCSQIGPGAYVETAKMPYPARYKKLKNIPAMMAPNPS